MKTIGILGAGQLGKMLADAANHLGCKTHVFAPDADPVAASSATFHTKADYNDIEALRQFASLVDVITLEFENIPVAPFRKLLSEAQFPPFYPQLNILEISQHRLREKQLALSLGIETAPFAAVKSRADLDKALDSIGIPGILKTCMFGYDGKGQWLIRARKDADFFQESENISENSAKYIEYIYEGFVPFVKEISVIVARNIAGEIMCFEPAENVHKNHILHSSTVPASISAEIADKAQNIAITLADHFQLVGLLAVEMFVTSTGAVLLNEMAPRPHNSGHWSLDGCNVSQFEQAIRAVCGMKLIKPQRLFKKIVMTNLIGDDISDLSVWKSAEYEGQQAKAHIHIYGKKEIRNGRKMGHVNVCYSG